MTGFSEFASIKAVLEIAEPILMDGWRGAALWISRAPESKAEILIGRSNEGIGWAIVDGADSAIRT